MIGNITRLPASVVQSLGTMTREDFNMRVVLSIIAGILILVGGVWILQGLNILGGSFMTGQTQWAVYGSIAALVGQLLLVLANRKRPTSV
jgi:hypothetical protein